MSFEENVSAVEAILFAYGEPLQCDLLSQASGIEKETLPKIADLLNDRYEKCGSSLVVLKLGNSYQLATRKKYAPYIKKAFESGKMSALSSAAMECLAIIAYNQPVTRSFVENVRGIDSSSVMNKLAEKGLIEEAERLDVPGHPISYKTTNNFLRCFSLSSLDELPKINENKNNDVLSNAENIKEL